MRLLDLFCCAGGAGEGYRRAGFDVTGVDIEPHPNNPHAFIQADAVAFLAEHGHEYDAIHASPPCQGYSALRALHPGKQYPLLIEPVRELLKASGKPYVIENVVGAPLENPFLLCGSMFGLKVRRHRIFESTLAILAPACDHASQPEPIDVSGNGSFQYSPRKKRTGGLGRKPKGTAEAREIMQMHWATRREISQAIPPAYTEWIGRHLAQSLPR